MHLLDVLVDPALVLLILAIEYPLIALAVVALAVLLIISILVLKKRRR